MNNIFNIKRFGLVLRKDFMENWRRYVLLFLTMLGVITIVNTWYSLSEYSNIKGGHIINLEYLNKQLLLFSSLMFGGFGLLFSSTFMTPMNSKIKRITYLSNPSSNAEKYLTRWIIITVGYIISFFIALYIGDILRVGICSVYYSEIDSRFLDITKLVSFEYENYYVFAKDYFIISICFYFLFQSLFVLGSTFWEKGTFVKTFTAVTLIILLYVLICRGFILFFYENIDMFGNVINSILPEKKDITQEQSITIIACITSFFSISNWLLAFFRFRESEIIKRL